MTRVFSRFAVPFLVLLMVGCRTAAVYNVEAAPIVANKAVSAEDVGKAIVRAGINLGWKMNPTGPGQMQGVLVLREHRAVVDITYDNKTYSIKYKDSSNLQYDGTVIHKNYNGWIQNLDRAIQGQLSTL